jgi:predicted RNA-binding Zn ribbon-like protein
MRLSRKYPVPREFALLYEFLNSLDLRRFQEHGVAHRNADEMSTVEDLMTWLRDRKLLDHDAELSAADHRKVLNLRESMRAWLQIAPADRPKAGAAANRVSRAAANFSLVLGVSKSGIVELRPAGHSGLGGIGKVLAAFYDAAATGKLGRLKMCASADCQWIFFDRSKPASRRWCSSLLCGNREKTRAYRERKKNDASARARG